MTELTAAQKRLIELDEQKPVIKQWYEDMDTTLAQIAAEGKLGEMFAAPDGTVFKIQPCEGRYVTFTPIEYVRTKREGEARGTLSMKEADEWRKTQEQ